MADSSQNIQLLISDYDGTLVGLDHTISEKVIDAVKKWQESGRIFTFATGRQYLMIKDKCKLLSLTHPVITRGGAEIVDPLTGKILYSKVIKKDTLSEFIKLLQENDIHISIEVGDAIYTNYYDNKNFPLVRFLPLNEFKLQDVPKLVIFADSNVSEKEKFVNEVLVRKFSQLHIVQIHSHLASAWDVTSLEATKHLAVLELMKMLGMETSEAAGVGDGYNDFPLLEAVGFKVAMGNANEDLKKIADLVVPTQENNGVAYLIDKLLE